MSGGDFAETVSAVDADGAAASSRGNGYVHRLYSESLAEFGVPRLLPRCGGWVLERPIRGTKLRDAMGCYPLFSCRRWSDVKADLDEIGDELVSLVVVTDPFGDYSERDLHHAFGHLARPFKTHFVVDLTANPGGSVHPHHVRNARKSLSVLTVDRCHNPLDYVEEWMSLYANLIRRHHIRGIAGFSARSFDYLSRVPGTVVLRASEGDQTVGMMWWLVDANVGYYHLGACSEYGYERGASFALMWTAIDLFQAHGLGWLDLGGSTGQGDNAADGLSRFKRRWSNATRTAYLCGRIFDTECYKDLTATLGAPGSNYFPAYRHGELS